MNWVYEYVGSSPTYPATQHNLTEKSTKHSGVSGNWRENSVGLRLVLKTKGAIKGLGVGTSFLRTMVTILKKEGWALNPNDKVVNGVLKMIENNNGECPCHNESEDKHCPCSDYREKDKCHCNLYVKIG